MFIEPVSGKCFFGREEILATLHKRVSAIKGGYRQNLALSGPMLCGKSSILRHFLKSLDDPDIIPIYIEMVDEKFDVFANRFMTSLLFRYCKSVNKPVKNNLSDLIESCKPDIPVTIKQIGEIMVLLDEKKHTEAYEKLLDITSVFKLETNKSCIVVFDEFHNLANFDVKKPFQVFGKFIMIQKNTMYIVTSSQKTVLKEILSKKLSLLFGNFEVIDVEGFDNETAKAFICGKARDMALGEEVRDYVLELTQGNPFYIDLIITGCSDVSKARKDHAGQKEILLEAVAKLIYESNGFLNQYFMNHVNFFLEKTSRRVLVQVLLSLAKGNSTVRAIRADISLSVKSLSEKLDALAEMDLVVKSGVFYKIQDKLFDFWLRNVYAVKLNTLVDDMDIKYIEFMNAVSFCFDRYIEFRRKNVVDVVQDLFGEFRNNKIFINMNERKLPFFDFVDSKNISGSVSEILGFIKNKVWMCHIKCSDIADETDIALLSGCRQYSGNMKIIRKVFIPLKGIEHTAYLLAKDAGIWVWDLKQLNFILRLFGKFEIVL
ncbi:MAG: ATP-binding protein [Candidatus Omnitrophica bacterium]|nr:ATP-binding protein [Candidatus Omnitrophota bacterium]